MPSRSDNTLIRLAVAVLSAAILAGCAAALVGGATSGALAVHDRRDLRTLVDDSELEIVIATRLRRDARFQRSNIKPVAFNGVVLLVGEVDREALRAEAEQLASAVDSVQRVVNELVVQPMTGPFSRSRSALMTAQVKVALSAIDLPDFDASRVKVTTVRREVYLMGLVTSREAEQSIEAARQVRGVERLFNVFEYIDDPAQR